MIDRLPSNEDAENVVLGALMNDPEVIEPVRATLVADDFSVEPRRKLFIAITEMVGSGDIVTPQSLTLWLKEHGRLSEVDGLARIFEISKSWLPDTDVEKWARKVKEYALRRRLILTAQAVATKCCDPTEELDALVSEMESSARTVYEESASSSALTGEQIIKAAGGPSAFFRPRPGIFTPLPSFNNLTGGLSPGDLFVIGARPSDGKTTLMMNFASYAAQRSTRVMVFTLEMTGDALMMRQISSAAGVSFYQLKMGYLSDEERRRVGTVTPQIATLPILYERKLGKTVLGIRGELRRAMSSGPIGMVCVDYLQRMRSPRSHKDRRTEIGEITSGLKDVAADFGVPLILLSQLTRASEKENRRPTMADLIESGNIEADADLIAFIHRPDKRAEAPGALGRAVLILEKQRNGETRDIEMVFDKRHGRFYEQEAEGIAA